MLIIIAEGSATILSYAIAVHDNMLDSFCLQIIVHERSLRKPFLDVKTYKIVRRGVVHWNSTDFV